MNKALRPRIRKYQVFNITITEYERDTLEPRFSYYKGGKYVFGVNTQFTQTELENLYLNGFFD